MTSKMADIETLLCPICQNEIKHELLERLKLEVKDLSIIEDLVNENILMQIVELGNLASKYFKPETVTTEIQVKDSLAKLSDKARELMEKHRELSDQLVKTSEEKKNKITEDAMKKQAEVTTQFQREIKELREEYNRLEQDHKHDVEHLITMMQQIQEKIIGAGIGDVREVTVIKDLKSACPTDEFSDETAAKKGADIVASVKENGNIIGSIVISVKDRVKWEYAFIEQVKKNLKEEQTDWGILVTKVFPSSALNDKMYLDENNILLVKIEYAPAAYMAMRQAVLYKNQAQDWINNQQESRGHQEQIFDVIRSWIDGEELKKIFRLIDEATATATEADDLLQKLQGHNEKQLKNAREYQEKIRKGLQQCTLILRELKDKLPVDS